ncbi:class IV adenylate cyclase [Aquirufa antheringensis]
MTQKARLANADVIASVLIAMGASFVGEDHQHDIYFQVQNGKLKFRHGTLGTLITHYERIAVGPLEKTHVYRYDVNPSEEEVRQLYAMHQIVGETHKIRKQYQFQNVTVHLDELPNGENYIEVEAKDYSNSFSEEDLQSQCKDLFEKLGIASVDLMQTGYL